MAQQLDWNDLRFFLEVARVGRLSRAARRLGVSHTTVARHVARLEELLHNRLFETSEDGLIPTDAGATLIPLAEEMEHRALEALDRLQIQGTLTGRVRIGAPDGFGNALLSRWLPEILKVEPQLEIELVPVPSAHKLWNRDVDIAISLDRPQTGRLVVRKLINYDLRLYAAPGFFSDTGVPAAPAALAGVQAVGYINELLYADALDFERQIHPELRTRYRAATVQAQLDAVQAGAGVGVLPCYMAREAALQPILPEQIRFNRAYWLLYGEDSRNLTRIRRVADFLYQETRKHADLFAYDPKANRGS